MPFDLTTVPWPSPARKSLVVEGHALVVLEHSYGSDRVRRVLFDRVDSLITWRIIPWIRLAAVSIFFLIPAFFFSLLIMDVQGPAAERAVTTIFFLALLAGIAALWAAMAIKYIFYRKTFIRFIRAGQTYEFAVIARPTRVAKFMAKVQDGIRRTQAAAAQRLAERRPAPPPSKVIESVILDQAIVPAPGSEPGSEPGSAPGSEPGSASRNEPGGIPYSDSAAAPTTPENPPDPISNDPRPANDIPKPLFDEPRP